MNNEKYEEFKKLTKELMIWLDRNYHPHTKIIIDSTTAELVEGIAISRNDDLVD